MKHIKTLRLLSAFLALVLLCGCGQRDPGGGQSTSEPQTAFAIPAFQDDQFHTEKAEDFGNVQADFSMLEEGVVGIEAESDSRLKLQVVCGEEKYNYDIPGDGSPTILPLNMGSGTYTFRLMESAGDDKYACTWSQEKQVTLADEFQPFLRPSQLVNYQESSQCVSKARELATDCATDIQAVGAVYDYLVEHIAYDQEKADTVSSGYLPDPDETLETGKGICFDYASLAAAMLRSIGIPCKLITGYVGGDSLYHAWNSVYLQNKGWITVEIQAAADQWQRIDITFAAGGMPQGQISSDDQYTTRYTY